MSDEHSVSHWILGLKAGEAEAAQRVWNRYADRLIRIARRKLGEAPKRVADEEDVVQNVFDSLCRGAASGRLLDVKTRDDLWWLLLALTRQKVVNQIRHETAQKRGAGRVQFEGVRPSSETRGQGLVFDQLVSQEPTPEYFVALEEEHLRLLNQLRDDCLRRIALLRIEGYTVPEIADQLAISVRGVERKLQLIRKAWARDLTPSR